MRRLPFRAALTAAAALAMALPVLSQAPAPAPVPAASKPIVPYDTGDKLGPARLLAATILAQEAKPPRFIVEVGAFEGEFLEAFMDRIPGARGQWTEQLAKHIPTAQRRLGRFGKRVDYVVGCPRRDITLGCVPKGADVIVTEWLSIHQSLKGIRLQYQEAAKLLPSGGWVVLLEHVGMGDSAWKGRYAGARTDAAKANITVPREGPPTHHLQYVTPTLDDQMAAFRDAGFTDVQVAWRQFDTVLLMARKP